MSEKMNKVLGKAEKYSGRTSGISWDKFDERVISWGRKKYGEKFVREYEQVHRTYRVQRRPVHLELGGGNLGPHSRGCLPAGTQGRGRGRSVKDLEIGAVDETAGWCERGQRQRQGEENNPLEFSSSFETLHFIMTNNNSLFYLSSSLLMTFRSLTYLGYSSEPRARPSRPLRFRHGRLMVILGPDHRTRHVSYFY
jgi:hypothetical protein